MIVVSLITKKESFLETKTRWHIRNILFLKKEERGGEKKKRRKGE